ncbi:MAG: MarR family transcriptional regulator [Pseudomonadota bacterium]
MAVETSDIGLLLKAAFDRYHHETLQRVRRAGFADVTPAQALVIAHLSDTPKNAVSIAMRVGVSKQAMSVTTTELTRKGYVTLSPDPTDRRARLLALSGRGRALKQASGQAKQAVEAQFATLLAEHDTVVVMDALRALAAAPEPEQVG